MLLTPWLHYSIFNYCCLIMPELLLFLSLQKVLYLLLLPLPPLAFMCCVQLSMSPAISFHGCHGQGTKSVSWRRITRCPNSCLQIWRFSVIHLKVNRAKSPVCNQGKIARGLKFSPILRVSRLLYRASHFPDLFVEGKVRAGTEPITKTGAEVTTLNY